MSVSSGIVSAESTEDLAAIRRLFTSYAEALNIDLAYQDFATELATLPGKYAAPEGALLLAKNAHDEPLGCIALRALPFAGCCEMKRLYIAPAARGTGIGQALVEAILREAMRLGYREMRLDTLPSMTAAIALYTKAGFAPIPPYYDTPIAETVFFGRRLP